MLALALSTDFAAASQPDPPCIAGVSPQPPYGIVGEAPNVETWTAATLGPAPAWASCIAWSTPTLRSLVAVAGNFRSADTADGILARFGAVSELLTVRYWSVTDRAWRPLVTTAKALTAAAAWQPRSDFSAEELRSGHNFYLAQQDSRYASEAVYRMRVRESTPSHIVIETENVTPVRWWGFTLFDAGDIQSVYLLDQSAAGTWSYYSLTKIAGSSWLAAGHETSYVNRVVALYRHLAGIPSDLEPPAAP